MTTPMAADTLEQVYAELYTRNMHRVLSYPPRHRDNDRRFLCWHEQALLEEYSLSWSKDNDNSDYVYDHNKWWFRGPEFRVNPDILCLGCSITYGIGVPEPKTWVRQLETLTALSCDNLGIPGLSTSEIAVIAQAVTRHLKPKYMVILLPDWNRQLLRNEFNHFLACSSDEQWQDRPENDRELSEWTISKTYYQLPESWRIEQFYKDLHTICRLAETTGIETRIGTWFKATDLLLQDCEIEKFKHCKTWSFVNRDRKGRDQVHPGVDYHRSIARAVAQTLL